MSTIFSKILAGDIPSYKIAEDESYYSFLDISPVQKGHALVIPKQEVDYIFDLDSETYQGLFAFAQRVAKAMDKAIDCQRIGVCVLGLEVRHAHVHLVPLNESGIIDFKKPREKVEAQEMQALAESIAANFQ